jgi:hypothetical protein
MLKPSNQELLLLPTTPKMPQYAILNNLIISPLLHFSEKKKN